MLSRRFIIAGGAATLLAPAAPPQQPARAQSLPRNGPSGAPVVRIGTEVFSADDPAAEWHDAGPATRRIFLRRGNWAIIWYLQDASPVDGKPFHAVVVERQRWTNLAAEMPAINYQVTLFGRVFPVNGHGDFQRWVMTSRAWPLSDRWIDDWNQRGLLLPWGIGPRLRAPGQWSYMDPVRSYYPLSAGGILPAMGTTGLRDEIGPIVNRQARYIMERSGELRAISLNYGLSASAIPWHVRGTDGLPLLLDRPGQALKLQQYYQNYPEERIISVSPGMQYDWQIDNAHRPNPSFIPALLTGLHPYFVEAQVFSACAALNSVAPETRGVTSKLIDEGQARDWAWSMRDMVLAFALLKASPRYDWLPAPERFEAILSANLDRAVRVMAAPGPGQLGMFWGEGLGDNAPNAASWGAQMTGGRSGVYIGCIADYVAYTLDWGRRLHADPRWLQLQISYAQRFQARRFLATGPLAFINLPVRLEGRWASDWREVGRTMRLPEDIARQRWYSFDKPLNDPRIYEYTTEYPTTFYTGLKLAQATGRAGAEVDTAVTLLEAQMGGGAAESWPAFAMRHG